MQRLNCLHALNARGLHGQVACRDDAQQTLDLNALALVV